MTCWWWNYFLMNCRLLNMLWRNFLLTNYAHSTVLWCSLSMALFYWHGSHQLKGRGCGYTKGAVHKKLLSRSLKLWHCFWYLLASKADHILNWHGILLFRFWHQSLCSEAGRYFSSWVNTNGNSSKLNHKTGHFGNGLFVWWQPF